MENLFETPKAIKADTETVTNKLIIGIETPLDIIIISWNGRESDQENPSSYNNNATPLFNKGKAKSNKL